MQCAGTALAWVPVRALPLTGPRMPGTSPKPSELRFQTRKLKGTHRCEGTLSGGWRASRAVLRFSPTEKPPDGSSFLGLAHTMPVPVRKTLLHVHCHSFTADLSPSCMPGTSS